MKPNYQEVWLVLKQEADQSAGCLTIQQTCRNFDTFAPRHLASLGLELLIVFVPIVTQCPLKRTVGGAGERGVDRKFLHDGNNLQFRTENPGELNR